MEAEFFHADGRTDRRDEANIRFSQLCKSAQRWNDWTHFRTFVQCTVYLRPQNPQHINTACSVQPVGLLIWQQSDSAVPFLSAVTVLKVWSFGCRHSIYKSTSERSNHPQYCNNGTNGDWRTFGSLHVTTCAAAAAPVTETCLLFFNWKQKFWKWCEYKGWWTASHGSPSLPPSLQSHISLIFFVSAALNFQSHRSVIEYNCKRTMFTT